MHDIGKWANCTTLPDKYINVCKYNHRRLYQSDIRLLCRTKDLITWNIKLNFATTADDTEYYTSFKIDAHNVYGSPSKMFSKSNYEHLCN